MNESLYRPTERNSEGLVPERILCVLCRRPNPNPASSACPTCIPPDEGEIRLQGKVAAIQAELDRAVIEVRASRNEVRDLQASCAEHVRIRNEQGERIAALEEMLRRVCCYAATARDENTKEWIQGLADRLNESAVLLGEGTAFVWHSTYGGECWIEAKEIP